MGFQGRNYYTIRAGRSRATSAPHHPVSPSPRLILPPSPSLLLPPPSCLGLLPGDLVWIPSSHHIAANCSRRQRPNPKNITRPVFVLVQSESESESEKRISNPSPVNRDAPSRGTCTRCDNNKSTPNHHTNVKPLKFLAETFHHRSRSRPDPNV